MGVYAGATRMRRAWMSAVSKVLEVKRLTVLVVHIGSRTSFFLGGFVCPRAYGRPSLQWSVSRLFLTFGRKPLNFQALALSPP